MFLVSTANPLIPETHLEIKLWNVVFSRKITLDSGSWNSWPALHLLWLRFSYAFYRFSAHVHFWSCFGLIFVRLRHSLFLLHAVHFHPCFRSGVINVNIVIRWPLSYLFTLYKHSEPIAWISIISLTLTLTLTLSDLQTSATEPPEPLLHQPSLREASLVARGLSY